MTAATTPRRRARRAPAAAPAAPAALTAADVARLEAALAVYRAAGAAPAAPPALVPRRSLARHHGWLAGPGWVAAADVAALTGHLMPWWPWGLAVIGTSALPAGARAAWTHRRRRPPARRYAAAAWTAGTGAALIGAAAGVASPAGQALMLGGGLAVAAPWLRGQRRRFRPGEPAAPVIAVTAERERPEITAFRDMFTRPGGALEGAEVGEYRRIEHGWQVPLLLVPGEQTTATAARLADPISSLYDLPLEQVSVEHDESRSRRRALLTVITDARAYTDVQRWAGSTLDLADGTITAGYFGDGMRARYQFFTDSGAAHGLITGSTGAGKSGFLSLLLAEAGTARDAEGRRLMRRWIIDPQAQSLPAWSGRVDLTALGIESSMCALRAFHAALIARSRRMGSTPWLDAKGREIRGTGRFVIDPALPLWVVIVDEMHMLLSHADYGKEATYLLADAGKLARKAGAKLVAGNQLASIAELKSRALRQSLNAMQSVAFRSAENLNGRLVGIEGNPFALPRAIPGLGFIASVDGRSGAPIRSVWVGREEDEVDAAELAGVLPLDAALHADVAAAAAAPLRVPGSPKWVRDLAWEYTGTVDGVGQVLCDAA